MKLCVLNSKLDHDPLYECVRVYLYNLPLKEYKKCILKGMISHVDFK